MNDVVVLDNDKALRLFMHSSLAASLALEINTGLKGQPVFFRTRRFTPMNACKEVCGSDKRNKRAVLREYVAWLESIAPERFGMEWSPNPSVRKAMGESEVKASHDPFNSTPETDSPPF